MMPAWTKASYRAYLRSPHWRALSARIIARADEHCEWCGRFCGKNPHPSGGDPCDHEGCRFCRFYYDEEGARTEREQQSLEVHHQTYERLGQERDDDLVALCWSCHDEITDRMWELKQQYRAGRLTRQEASHGNAAWNFARTFWRALCRKGPAER